MRILKELLAIALLATLVGLLCFFGYVGVGVVTLLFFIFAP